VLQETLGRELLAPNPAPDSSLSLSLAHAEPAPGSFLSLWRVQLAEVLLWLYFDFMPVYFFRCTSICLLQVPDLVRSVKHGQSTRGSCIHASFWDTIQHVQNLCYMAVNFFLCILMLIWLSAKLFVRQLMLLSFLCSYAGYDCVSLIAI